MVHRYVCEEIFSPPEDQEGVRSEMHWNHFCCRQKSASSDFLTIGKYYLAVMFHKILVVHYCEKEMVVVGFPWHEYYQSPSPQAEGRVTLETVIWMPKSEEK